jgi:SAM-dependent methyltransferase
MSKDLFTNYYLNNSWQGEQSRSGPGSDYEQTKYLVPELQLLLKSLNIKSILDVPCGDFNWMKEVDLSGIKYIGGDIVEPMIRKNIKKYKQKNINFEIIDIINDDLPLVDMIMVRDCFVHLPNSDIFKSIENIRSSGSKYLLTTHFSWRSENNNKNINAGAWRRLNLQQPPFNFPNPEYLIIEGNVQSNDRDKTVSLWKVKDIPGYNI